ncbi:MAG TPA: histidine phosphatase family protein [Pyrinomonadaceae bacterium]|nr:histidine phosphatase family protein [Pyrinomonadaceae bacterium]
MKRLLLLRHAKSSWAEPGLADFDRPLNERGLRAAPLVGRFLLRRKLRPDLVLSSPAERARRTAALVAEAAGLDAPVRYDERIYEAPAGRLVEVVSELEEAAEEVLLVGHNPGMEELIELLAGERQGMPTAALARVSLGVEKWSRVRAGTGRLELHVRPRELEE